MSDGEKLVEVKAWVPESCRDTRVHAVRHHVLRDGKIRREILHECRTEWPEKTVTVEIPERFVGKELCVREKSWLSGAGPSYLHTAGELVPIKWPESGDE